MPLRARGCDQDNPRVFEIRYDRIQHGQCLGIDPLHAVNGQHQALSYGVFRDELRKCAYQ